MGIIEHVNFDLSFKADSPLVTLDSASYRPPSFPPTDDWVITVDKEGKQLSRYGDSHWDYSAFGYFGFNFDRQGLSEANMRLVKQALVFVLYSPLFPGKIKSCEGYFFMFGKIAKICDRNKILISDISRYESLYGDIHKVLKGSHYEVSINYLHRLLQLSQQLGFVIADKRLIRFLANQSNDHQVIQYAYIPPRIWSYQVNRLNECLDDFIAHEEAIESMFNVISRAPEKIPKL
jgi:hypothetical protein